MRKYPFFIQPFIMKPRGPICFAVLVSFLFFSSHAQPLKKALEANDTLTALQLLKNGADINEKDSAQGNNVIQSFCRWGTIEIVKFLLDHGANPDMNPSAKGRTALHVACAYYSCADICTLLIAHGANVNAKTIDGSTPLMLAAANAKKDVVELLLNKGAIAAQKDNAGNTALKYASALTADTENYVKKATKTCIIDKAETLKILTKAIENN